MEVNYNVTLFYNDGKTEKLELKCLDESMKIIMDKLKTHPECCAHIMSAEFEKETPHRQFVKIDRYENKNGKVTKVPY